MRALITHGRRELYSTLRNVVHRMTPMATTRSGALHDCVVAAYRIARFIYKRHTAPRLPEYLQEFFRVRGLKVCLPFWIVERIQHQNRHIVIRLISLRETLRERGFTALCHPEYKAVAHSTVRIPTALSPSPTNTFAVSRSEKQKHPTSVRTNALTQ